MNNLHLVPVNIQDLVDKLSEKGVRGNERYNYMLRLEAIRDYCSAAINSQRAQAPVIKRNTRRMP